MRKNKGFTLVELVVVVAILAVLMAVLIPYYMQYVGKSRAAVCASDRAELVHAADIARITLPDGKMTADDVDALMLGEGLSKIGGNVAMLGNTQGNAAETTQKYTGLCPSDGDYTVTINSDGGIEVSCSEPEHGGTGFSFGNKADMDIIITNMSTDMDSTAPDKFKDDNGISERYNTETALKMLGIDLKVMGAVTWRHCGSGTGERLYWSNQDISTLPVGTKIPIMCYNPSSGNYTVWMCTVESKTNRGSTYNVINQFKKTTFNDKPGAEQTYENALKYYNDTVKNQK